ncbi:MAG: C13 family peptidase [Caldilineaceae bacterium]
MQSHHPLHAGLLISLLISLLLLLLTLLSIDAPSTAKAAPATPTAQPLTAIIQLASRYDHTCALTSSGGVKCWGANWTGQLGDGTTTYRALAVPVSGLTSTATALATGADHTCVVTSTGSVQCWGGNNKGQLGNGTTSTSYLPVTAVGLEDNVSAVVAGAYHTCALTIAGGVLCWGDNEWGQLGDNTQVAHAIPTSVAGLPGGVTALTAGDYHTCALTTAGAVRCWGGNHYGQLGDGTQTTQPLPVTVNTLGVRVIAMTAGNLHTCAILVTGGLLCWGANGYGQLGDGLTDNRLSPAAVVGLSANVVAVAGGGSHTCALQSISGVAQAFCWGANWHGALGDGTLNNHVTPVAVVGLRPGGTALAAGGSHTCALINSGAPPENAPENGVQCWGSSRYGQLGDSTPLYNATPSPVSDLPTGVVTVAVGEHHTCALQNSRLFCWGANGHGQLAIGDYGDTNLPKPVVGLTDTVTAVTAGKYHTCTLTTAGALFCWGGNGYGQLGNGSASDQSGIGAVQNLTTGVKSVDAGGRHTCALDEQGALFCWGANWDGRLGDGTDTQRVTPVAVQSLPSPVTAVAAGDDHTCALTTAGAVYCWGYNDKGQIGDGTTVEQHTPVKVDGLSSGVIAIAVGASHSCALLDKAIGANRVFCWGGNQAGQVGDGTTVSRTKPVAVPGLPPQLRALIADTDQTCAITEAGGVFCWGANRYGQLGDGTTVDRTQPTAVSNLSSGVVALDAGDYHTCAVTTAGSVLCWGLDNHGQLGAGGQRWRTTPVDVVEEGVAPTVTPTATPEATVTATITSSPTVITATPTSTPTRPPAADGDAFEADDTCASAGEITTNGAIQPHTFHQADDQDWVRFAVTAGITYTIEADAPAPSPADLVLALYAQCNSGATQTQDYDFSPNARLTFVAPTSGVYYLRLRNQQSTVYGATVTYQLSVRALTTNHMPGALIIVAGRNKEEDALQSQIHNVTNRVYRLWRNQGYPAERIRYFATDQNLDPDNDGRADVDGLPDQDNLRTAITQWAVDKVGPQQALTLYLMDHGSYDTLYLDEPRRERLSPQQLDQWLTQLEEAAPGVKITVLLEACNAGSFIDPAQSISKPGRVVIASTGAYELAWATHSGAAFSDPLLDGLAMGKTLLSAFYEAKASAGSGLLGQTAWLDDDGDRVPNDPDDGQAAAQLSFRTVGSLGAGDTLWQPYIVWGEVRRPAIAATSSGEIWAEVRDDRGVQTVVAVIYPPSYQAPTAGEELVAGPPPITLQARGSDRYAGTYSDFTESGDYRIFIYALDQEGLHSSPKEIRFNNGSRLFLPLVR